MQIPSKKQRKKRPASEHPRLPIALAACALIALVLIGYYNSLSNGFVWDDHQQIVMNPALKPDAPIIHIFTSDVRFAHQYEANQNRTYRPLQLLTYRMLGAAFGFTPTPFHLFNLLLAIGGALAAFAVFYLLLKSTLSALAAASLFAVHPIHTEAIDWIAASPDLGCGLFVLLAFAFFLLASRKPTSSEAKFQYWHRPSLSYAAFAISLLWKETAATLPLLIAAYVLLVEKPNEESSQKPSESRPRAALKAIAPYAAILGLYLIVRTSALGSLSTGQRDWTLTPFQFLLNTLHLMLSYWQKLALPLPLNAYYLFSPIRSLSDPRAIAAIAFTLIAIAALVYLIRRAPLCTFAALWVFITLLPVMNIYAVGRNVFAERYLYLPSVGFCLLVTIAATCLIKLSPAKLQRPASVLLTLIVVTAFAAETINRNPDWSDDKTLFTQTLNLSPDAPFVRIMVASRQSDDPTESAGAEQNYLQAISLAKNETPPDRFDLAAAYKGLASLYGNRADNQRALQTLAQARELAPADPELDSEQGLLLAHTGRWSEAEPLLQKTLAAQPQNENVLSTLGLVAWQYHHDDTKAIELFTKALAVHPEQDDFSASLHSNLGAVYADLGDSASTIQQLKQAVAIAPRDPEYHTNLANALGAAKHFDEARAEAETALQLAPGYPPAQAVLNNLGVKP